MDLRIFAATTALCVIATVPSYARGPINCADVEPTASHPLANVQLPPAQVCTPHASNGLPVPDPACTPGAFNPSVTADILGDASYSTSCVRNRVTSESDKHVTYTWYGLSMPADNRGQNQVCELDHFIPLELGGADTLDNIWPQCGPDAATLNERYFKLKDAVENYLAAQVKAGAMDLGEAQRGIAADWTQYLSVARSACPGGRCR